MRNRNLLDRKLSILEGTLTVLDMIEAEPMSPSEMNKT